MSLYSYLTLYIKTNLKWFEEQSLENFQKKSQGKNLNDVKFDIYFLNTMQKGQTVKEINH